MAKILVIGATGLIGSAVASSARGAQRGDQGGPYPG